MRLAVIALTVLGASIVVGMWAQTYEAQVDIATVQRRASQMLDRDIVAMVKSEVLR